MLHWLVQTATLLEITCHSSFCELLIYRQMEKDVEERLRAKFALIDRTDPSAIQAAQQVIILENMVSLRFHSLDSTSTSHIFIRPHTFQASAGFQAFTS